MRRSVANAAASQRMRDLDRSVGVERPRMEQVEVARSLLRRGQVGGVGQPGRRILGREARDVVGGAHRLLERGAREVGAAGVAAPLADVHA